MLRFVKQAVRISLIAVACLTGLSGCYKTKKQEYSLDPNGYYYKLISFSTDTLHYRPGYMLHLSASFSTQKDSVFWDSYSNTGDRFFIRVDSSSANFFEQYSSTCAVDDSACLLIKPADFFSQQFKTPQIPFFSRNDSVVKVRFKIKQLISSKEFAALNLDLKQKEQEQIHDYYRSDAAYRAARDSLGFYWVQRPAGMAGNTIKSGNSFSLWYRGYYLNGRFLEASPAKFELVYGTPDQLLKGLNYVIGCLKIGQNAKIILPSRLAFGENGSTNGLVPPFTPLLYEIKITDIKQ